MRAVRYERYGSPDVLQVVEIPEPTPEAGDVKVKVFAASLDPLDWKIRAGHLRFVPLFAPPPRTVGVEFAGDIVAVGGGPGPRHVGERVFGSLSPYRAGGSCAEYVVIRAHRVAPIPDGIPYESAAATPIAAGTAAQAFFDDAKLATGQRVLVNGAAGGVGHFAVQVAKHLKAHVVATCSATNVAFVQALGADEVLDYAASDVVGELAARSEKFDVVLDAADTLGWQRASRIMKRGGLYLSTGGSFATAVGTAAAGLFAPLVNGTRAQTFLLNDGGRNVRRLADLLAQRVLKPHIAHSVPLDGVADAQRRMELGHGRGKTVVLPHGPVVSSRSD